MTDTGASVWQIVAEFGTALVGVPGLTVNGRSSSGARLEGTTGSLGLAEYGNRGISDATRLAQGG